MVSAAKVPSNSTTFIGGHWVYRSVLCRGSIYHTICSLSCKFWHRLSTVAVLQFDCSPCLANLYSLCGGCGHRGVMQKGPKEVKTAVGYTRVSTARQGLGREAQAAALARFAEAEGYVLAETFTEVETGKGSDALDRRPQLS